jgi:hypothetical protein
MTAVQINAWKPVDPKSPGWMTVKRINDIVNANNKNADGSYMIDPTTYDKDLYLQMRDLTATLTQYTSTFAGVQAYEKMMGPSGTMYTMLMFSTLDTYNAYKTTVANEPLLQQFKAVRDEMLNLTKVELTLNDAFETSLTVDEIKALDESGILSLLANPK